MKPLGKLRHKPQVSEAFHCSSIGICADSINPEPVLHSAGLELMESAPKTLCDINSIAVDKYRILVVLVMTTAIPRV